MPETTVSEKIMERLAKLMAQEEGERALGNLEAAALFAEKVQELLVRHKLALSDVEAFAEDRDNPFNSTRVNPPDWGERWKPRRIERIENLADIVARAHFCRLMVVPKYNCVLFAGRKGDTQVAAYVFRRLARTAWELCEKDREAAKKRAQRTPGEHWAGNKVFRYNFYWGFSKAIAERYAAQRGQMELEAGNCQALIRAERDVERYCKERAEGRVADDSELTESRERENRQIWLKGYLRGQEVNLKNDALNSAGKEALRLGEGGE